MKINVLLIGSASLLALTLVDEQTAAQFAVALAWAASNAALSAVIAMGFVPNIRSALALMHHLNHLLS